MKIGHPLFGAFVRYMAMYFVGLILLALLPSIANYYWQFAEPFPTREGLLDLIWILLPLAAFGALGTLILARRR